MHCTAAVQAIHIVRALHCTAAIHAVHRLLTSALFCIRGRYVSGMSFTDHTPLPFGSSWKYGWYGLAGSFMSAHSLAAAEP